VWKFWGEPMFGVVEFEPLCVAKRRGGEKRNWGGGTTHSKVWWADPNP